MKTVWKWILGIVIVLVVAGLVFGAVFAWQHGAFTMRRAPFAYSNFTGKPPQAIRLRRSNQTNPLRPLHQRHPSQMTRVHAGQRQRLWIWAADDGQRRL